MNKTLLYGGLGIIGFIFIIVIYLLASERPMDIDREQDMISSESDPTRGDNGDNGGGDVEGVPGSPEHQLELYRRWAKYPPYSRPLFAGQVDRTDPFNANRPPIKIIAEPGKGCKRVNRSGAVKCEQDPKYAPIKCTLLPEKSISLGSEDFDLYLRCFKIQEQKQVDTPFTISGIEVYRMVHRKRYNSLPPIARGDDGANGDKEANDGIYTIRVRPGSQDWGWMSVEVTLEVGGFKHAQKATWFSTPHTVAEFKPGTSESLQEGSLVVKVPVKILKAGYYIFNANLQESGGDKRFIATSSWEGDLEVGNRTIEYRFFGKIIRDKGINGPYLVRNIRGKRNNGPMPASRLLQLSREGKKIPDDIVHTEPGWEYFASANPFSTESHKSNDFSNKEWNSPDKDHRIKFLEKLAAGERK